MGGIFDAALADLKFPLKSFYGGFDLLEVSGRSCLLFCRPPFFPEAFIFRSSCVAILLLFSINDFVRCAGGSFILGSL